MRTRIVTSFDELDALSPRWQQLREQSEFASMFSDYAYMRAAWRAFGESLSLRTVVIEDHCGPRLIAPFFTTVTDRQLRPLGGLGGDYAGILFARGDQESVGELFRWLRWHSNWNKLELRNLPEDSLLLQPFLSAPPTYAPFVQRLRNLSNARPAYVDKNGTFPYIDLRARPQYSQLLDHKSNRRDVNWFNKLGKLTYEAITDRDACLAMLPEYFAMHRKEWSTRSENETMSPDAADLSKWFAPDDSTPAQPLPLSPTRRFYECLVEELCPAKNVRFDVLALDSRPIALSLNFVDRGRLQCYRIAHDPEFRQHGPGRILTCHILRQVIECGLQEVDLGCGNHPYKLELASGVRKAATLTLYRTPADAASRELSQFMKRVPRR